MNTSPHLGVLSPGGKAEALAEDIVDIEAEEEVPDMEVVVEAIVTPEELVVLAEDVDIVIEEVVEAGAEAEEYSSVLILMLIELEVVDVTGLIELNLPGRRFR